MKKKTLIKALFCLSIILSPFYNIYSQKLQKLLAKEQYDKAEQYCEKQKGAEQTESYKILADAYFDKADYEKASTLYHKADFQKEGSLKIANIYLKNRNYAMAVKHFTTSFDDSKKANLEVAEFCYKENDFNKASEFYLKSNEPDKGLFKIAEGYFSKKDYTNASKYYNMSGKSEEGNLKIADQYFKESNQSKAYSYYLKAKNPHRFYKNIHNKTIGTRNELVKSETKAKIKSWIITKTIYLSLDKGNDLNNGLSKEKPLRTLQKALLIAQNIPTGYAKILVLGSGNFKFAPDKNSACWSIEGAKNIIIEAEGEIVIDADKKNSHALFLSDCSNIAILNFTFTGGYSTLKDSKSHNSYGGGLYMSKCNQMILYCEIKENYTRWGGGLYMVECNNNVIAGEISKNSVNSGGSGGGIMGLNSHNNFFRLTVDGNIASDRGGGFYLWECNDNEIFSAVTNNKISFLGGGIFLFGNNNKIRGFISDNKAMTGGGVFMHKSTKNVFEKNLMIGDNSASNGGGIYISESNDNSFNASITNNKATSKDGGGGFFNKNSFNNKHNGVIEFNLPNNKKVI